ncbi:hypothetical protein AYO37_00960 [Opitutia bacterium SCGC AG-212-L18]|nr:hypothetical protein AYO37_00960 [Opitutae bacterium SCGC AG-212-L18]
MKKLSTLTRYTLIALTISLCNLATNLMAVDPSSSDEVSILPINTSKWGSTRAEKVLESVLSIKSAAEEANFIESMRLYARNITAYQELLFSKNSLTHAEESDLKRLIEHKEWINRFLSELNGIDEIKQFFTRLTNAAKTGKEEGIQEAKGIIAKKLNADALEDEGIEYMHILKKLDRGHFGKVVRQAIPY